MQAFLDDIGEHPDDPGVRLIFADWLEDHDDPRAELLRLQVEYTRLREDIAGQGKVGGRVQEWAETYAGDWLGPIFQLLPAASLNLGESVLDVLVNVATRVLRDKALDSLRQCLRQGWIISLWLESWPDSLIEEAAKLGLLARLRTLWLMFGEWSDRALECLRGSTRLRVLNAECSGTGPTDDGMAHLSALTGLQELGFRDCPTLTGEGLAHLSDLTRLRSLSLDNCAGVTRLPSFAHLETLSLKDCNQFTGEGLAHPAGMALRELSLLECGGLTEDGLTQLAGLAGLRKLYMGFCERFTDAAMAHLAGLVNLEELNLDVCTQVTSAGVAHLAGLVGLRKLTLGYCEQLTDTGLVHLAGLVGLRKLTVEGCGQLTDVAVAHLAGLVNLEELDLSGCTRITGAGLAHLHHLHGLRRLELRGCKLKPHETRALRKALPLCEVVRK
jgi:uncharacterized protein (TIGR02996 family)